MLSAHRLSCIRHQQLLFSALEFELVPGEILYVTGRNGCGKSSLLHILMGLLLPFQGEVRWQGASVLAKDPHYYIQLSYIGHKPGIKDALTVLENLQMAAQLASAQCELNWAVILAHFGLQHLKHTLCHQLSAGQRQRVALTRLLLGNTRLWVLDEPFTALDQETVKTLQRLLEGHVQQGGMVVLTSHQGISGGTINLKQLALT